MQRTDADVLTRREAIEAPLDPNRYTVLRRLMEREDNKVVVSMGGGALPGLCGNIALAGILEELELQDRVEEVWGTSAGSVVGGLWAAGSSSRTILDLVRSLGERSSLDFNLLRFGFGILLSLWPFRRPLPDGLIGGNVFWELLEGALQVEKIEDCPKNFRCIACSDDGRATGKVFRHGALLPAIFASMTIPGVVIPRIVPEEGRAFYDGGLVEKSPLASPVAEHLRSGDKRKLLVLCTHFDNAMMQTATRGFFNRFMHTFYAMEEQIWDYQVAEARRRENVNLILLNPQLADSSLFSFENTDMNHLAARERFVDVLQNARIAHTFGTT